jgi:hypothetical protein
MTHAIVFSNLHTNVLSFRIPVKNTKISDSYLKYFPAGINRPEGRFCRSAKRFASAGPPWRATFVAKSAGWLKLAGHKGAFAEMRKVFLLSQK